jgi:hypothetical protein
MALASCSSRSTPNSLIGAVIEQVLALRGRTADDLEAG